MEKSANFFQIVREPFKGLILKLGDSSSVMTSLAIQSLFLETKRFAWSKGFLHVGLRELFYVLMEENLRSKNVASKILKRIGIDHSLAQIIIYHRVELRSKEKCSIDAIKFDSKLQTLIQVAREITKNEKRDFIWTHHILLAFFEYEGGIKPYCWSPKRILRQIFQLDPARIKKVADIVIPEFNEKEEHIS